MTDVTENLIVQKVLIKSLLFRLESIGVVGKYRNFRALRQQTGRQNFQIKAHSKVKK